MVRNGDIPDLLETYMEECGGTGRWITVSEFRDYFNLDIFSSHAISGFFSRIYRRPCSFCPYRVERIKKIFVKKPHHRIINQYLVKMRPFSKIRTLAQERAKSIHDDVHDPGKWQAVNRVLCKRK